MRKALTPWRPLRELSLFRHEPVDLFERFFTNWNWPRFEWQDEWDEWVEVPKVETHVEGNTLTVKADLPGIEPKEVELSVEGNHLTIKGERKAEEEHEKDKVFHREVRYGSFERTLTLPAEVEAERIEANYHNGVLEVKVPLPEEVTPKKVAIEVSGEEPEKEAA